VPQNTIKEYKIALFYWVFWVVGAKENVAWAHKKVRAALLVPLAKDRILVSLFMDELHR
jgi:hypothetical protein